MTRPKLKLSLALTNSLFNRPLIEGRVMPQGAELIPTVIHPSEMYWRQLRYAEFDISEMSISSLLISWSRGDTRWIALPIFTMRRFFHTDILVHSESGINYPADLRGKRVGVPEYQQTSAVWSRGILQEEFGVHPSEIHWFMERVPEKSHGGITGFKPPDRVKISQILPNTNIGEMLKNKELDATLLYLNHANLVDRSRLNIMGSGTARRLFVDPITEGRRYYEKTGIYPPNHTVVVRASLIERHPWLALNLYSAFQAARTEIENNAREALTPLFETQRLGDEIKSSITKDPMPYGFKAATPVLARITKYLFEQGLSDRLVDPKEAFASATHEI